MLSAIPSSLTMSEIRVARWLVLLMTTPTRLLWRVPLLLATLCIALVQFPTRASGACRLREIPVSRLCRTREVCRILPVTRPKLLVRLLSLLPWFALIRMVQLFRVIRCVVLESRCSGPANYLSNTYVVSTEKVKTSVVVSGSMASTILFVLDMRTRAASISIAQVLLVATWFMISRPQVDGPVVGSIWVKVLPLW